jgi:hypothetical protein
MPEDVLQYVERELPVEAWKELNLWYSCSYGTREISLGFRSLNFVTETF